MKVRLLPQASVDQAINTFRDLAADIHNQAMVRGLSPSVSDRLDAYARWAVQAERQLLNLIGRQAALELLDSTRHRALLAMPPVLQAVPILNAEIDAKRDLLASISQEMDAEKTRMTTAPGCPVLLDTKVLLQAVRPDQIPWDEIAAEPIVRLMIPLRVVEELDAKKYGDSRRLRSVARSILPWLEGLFPDPQPGPVPLPGRSNTTIEVLLADNPRRRPEDPDEEILDTCQDVLHLTGRVKLVTADTGMRLRARSLSLEVVSLPHRYERSGPPNSTTDTATPDARDGT